MTPNEVLKLVPTLKFSPLSTTDKEIFSGASDNALIATTEDEQYIVILDDDKIEVIKYDPDMDDGQEFMFVLSAVAA